MSRKAKAKTERPCAVCGKIFLAADARHICCGPACRAERARQTARRYQEAHSPQNRAVCPVCGAEFVKTNQNHTWCSDACREKGREAQRWQPERVVCALCGKTFLQQFFRQSYCSHDCRAEANRQRTRDANRRQKAERQERREAMREAAAALVVSPEAAPLSAHAMESSVRSAEKRSKKRGRKPNRAKPGSIAWCAAEAAKRGMSYGAFVAAMDSGPIAPAPSDADFARREWTVPGENMEGGVRL